MKYRIDKYTVALGCPGEPLSSELICKEPCFDVEVYAVQVKKWYGWVTIKEYFDLNDNEFSRLEAEELLEHLQQ